MWILNGTTRLEATFTATEVDLDTAKQAPSNWRLTSATTAATTLKAKATASPIHGITTSPSTNLRGVSGLTSMFPERPSRCGASSATLSSLNQGSSTPLM